MFLESFKIDPAVLILGGNTAVIRKSPIPALLIH
jgi:hypothetical protein